MLKGAVAKRYAKALYDSANAQQVVEEVAKNLKEITEVLQQSEELKHVLVNPTIAIAKKQSLITDVFGAHVLPLVLRFYQVLIERHREAYFIPVVNEFIRLYDLEKGRIKVRVESAVELSEQEIDHIKERLTVLNKQEIEVTTFINSSLIGGIRVTIGDKVIDASVKSQLDQFRNALVIAQA